MSPGREGTVRRVRRVLHATDFSRASARAFAEAVELARRERARLVVLHVLVPPSPFVAGEQPASWLDLQARARQHARRLLAAVVAEAERAGVGVEGKLVEGAPAEAIVRVARRDRAGLIVIGTHGRSGLGRLFMGSVAERVLALARCPVLTVRGR